ncbi:MAG: hypothetical protein NTX15_01845 [Candidatus Kapabacteria bacterium]|nr:hypothetical protein [Candidatus Kapabacteria bacterium]
MVIERCGQKDGETWIEVTRSRGLWSRLATILRIRSHIKRENVSRVILTTASGTYQWMFLSCLPYGVTSIGILHYMHLLGTSVTQGRIEKKLDAYVVISPHVLEMPHQSPAIPIHVVPQNARLVSSDIRVPNKGPDDVWIVVPGTVDMRRRAYEDLFCDEVLGRLPPNARVIVLGNAGKRSDPVRSGFYRMVDTYASRVTVFEEFMDHQSFHAWMSRADIVLPLLHPQTAEYQDFLTDKCSGAFSMAWAYGLPLLLENGFSRFTHLQHGTIFYDVKDLGRVLVDAVSTSTTFNDVRVQAQSPEIGDEMRLRATLHVLETPHEPLLS